MRLKVFKWLLGTPPVVGSVWVTPDNVGNPFLRGDDKMVIDAVQDKWVQYHRGTASGLQFSMSIRSLRSLYRETVKEVPK